MYLSSDSGALKTTGRHSLIEIPESINVLTSLFGLVKNIESIDNDFFCMGIHHDEVGTNLEFK